MILAVIILVQFSRLYHPISVLELAAENPASWKRGATHVEVTGWLTYKKREEDGDWHLRICSEPGMPKMDASRCIVAECIPAMPCVPPKRGSHVRVRGITRYDAESPGHHWWEVHPVEFIETIP